MIDVLFRELFRTVSEYVCDQEIKLKMRAELTALQEEMENMDEVIKRYEDLVSNIAGSVDDGVQHVSQRSDSVKPDDHNPGD